MSKQNLVYDLGEASLTEPARAIRRAEAHARMGTVEPLHSTVPRMLSGSLSLFLPGAGHLIRGDVSMGLFYLSALGFVSALVWAILEALERLTDTLELFGYPRAAGLGALLVLYGSAGLLYLGNVLSASPSGRAHPATSPHPVAAALASSLLPGWGQVLNGDRLRATAFLAALWLIAGGWILGSVRTDEVLDSLGLFLPAPVVWLCSPVACWTAMVVIWSLAIYDAASSAASRR